MAAPTTAFDLTATIADNQPPQSEGLSGGDDQIRALAGILKQTLSAGSDIASASSITPAASASSFNLTGTTTVTAIASSASWDGRIVWFRHTGAHAFTHSSTLVCLGGASITFASGDISAWRQRTSGTWDQVAVFRTGTVPFGTSLFTTSDGRVYGTALHNNAGAVTGTTNQYVASGTYTPTLTNVLNVSSSTAFTSSWMRVGNVVTVSGVVSITPTSSASTTQLGISLPIASALAADEVNGVICSTFSGLGNLAGEVYGDAINNRASAQIFPTSGGANSWRYHFTYEIV